MIEVNRMSSEKIKLTAKDILEKEFKAGMRGYKPEEVDQFLDIVIRDYETFQQEIEDLKQENLKLRKKLEENANKPVSPSYQQAAPGTTNFDILKRLSNLEKHVFGSKLYD